MFCLFQVVIQRIKKENKLFFAFLSNPQTSTALKVYFKELHVKLNVKKEQQILKNKFNFHLEIGSFFTFAKYLVVYLDFLLVEAATPF